MRDQFLKIETAAEMLDVSVWTVRKWISDRKIRTYRFGCAVRIKEADLLDFARITPSSSEFANELVLEKDFS